MWAHDLIGAAPTGGPPSTQPPTLTASRPCSSSKSSWPSSRPPPRPPGTAPDPDAVLPLAMGERSGWCAWARGAGLLWRRCGSGCAVRGSGHTAGSKLIMCRPAPKPQAPFCIAPTFLVSSVCCFQEGFHLKRACILEMIHAWEGLSRLRHQHIMHMPERVNATSCPPKKSRNHSEHRSSRPGGDPRAMRGDAPAPAAAHQARRLPS